MEFWHKLFVLFLVIGVPVLIITFRFWAAPFLIAYEIWVDPPGGWDLQVTNIKQFAGRTLIQFQGTHQIGIDNASGSIDYISTSMYLFSKEHKGSGWFGAMLFTLPIALLMSPVLLAANKAYARSEARNGCSRYSIRILRKLKPQLDEELYNRLETALKRLWAADQDAQRAYAVNT